MLQYDASVRSVILSSLLILSVISFIPTSAGAAQQAETFVESDITEDTTWSPSEGPYRVVSSITLKKNVTLTIEPGTTVEFIDDAGIALEGDVQALGSTDDPIVMRSVEDGSYGFYNSDEILDENKYANDLRFEHVRFTGGFTGFDLSSTRGNVTFHNVTTAAGISFESGGPTITVTDSRFNGTSFQIRAGQATDVTVRGNTFRGASQTPVLIETSDKNSPIRNVTITENRIEGNEGSGIRLASTTDTGSANFQAPIEDVRIENNIVRRNAEHGILLRAKPQQDLGGVKASISDTKIVANNVRSNGGTGIGLRSLSTGNPGSTVARNIVLDHQTGLAIESVRTNVTRNAIGHNQLGIEIEGTNENVLNVTENNVYENDVGLSSTGNANATVNYWGHETGPEHDANPEGEGDSIEADAGQTDFLPFADAQIQSVPLPEPQSQQATEGGSQDGEGQSGENADAADDDVADFEDPSQIPGPLSIGQIMWGVMVLVTLSVVMLIVRAVR